MQIGEMPMPATFKYRNVFNKGMPVHEKWDAFSVKHPPMPAARWAKIFAPFDALNGFHEAIETKEKERLYLYLDRTELSDDEKQEQNHDDF